MKNIYRNASDLNGVPNGLWKMYALPLLKHGPIEADLETGAVHQVGEMFYYKDGILHRGDDLQPQTDEVLVPTEVIDPPSKVAPVRQPAPAPKQPSHVHAVLRGMVGQAALGQAYASAKRIQRLEAMQKAASRMSTEQKQELVRRKK